MIDWESIGRALQGLPIDCHRWVSKYMSGHFATGNNMQRWHFRSSMLCLHCMALQEDKQHILSCPTPAAQLLWEKSLKELEVWLKEEGTDPSLCEHLMEYLCTWNLPTTDPSEPPPVFSGTRCHQQTIPLGWLGKQEVAGSSRPNIDTILHPEIESLVDS